MLAGGMEECSMELIKKTKDRDMWLAMETPMLIDRPNGDDDHTHTHGQ